jgi:hypothetical protein
MAAINIKRAEFHGARNYTASPNTYPPNLRVYFLTSPKIGEPGSGRDGAATAATMSEAVDALAGEITAGIGAATAAIVP